MSTDDDLRSFGMRNLQIYHELQRIEHEYGIDLRAGPRTVDRESRYYARFEADLRRAAASMSQHYEVFYCLENSIREFISDIMESAYGFQWWNEKVDQVIRSEATRNRSREDEMGMAPRSEAMIDYITFGQLGQIIDQHWDVFAGVLHNRQAVVRVMKSLNTLRGPIAHCNPLPEDEVVRLRLALQDWFRQLE